MEKDHRMMTHPGKHGTYLQVIIQGRINQKEERARKLNCLAISQKAFKYLQEAMYEEIEEPIIHTAITPRTIIISSKYMNQKSLQPRKILMGSTY